MSDYFLGHAAPELDRLQLQEKALRPITRRLLQDAGLMSGMSVLDMGCGTGDVSLLAAEIVGPTGKVVGIDPDASAIGAARERAASIGIDNVIFRAGTEQDDVPGGPFDLLVGRYVLVHQSDPVSFVRNASRHLRDGGTVAFHEPALPHAMVSDPPVPSWQDFTREYAEALQRNLKDEEADAATHLAAIFAEAGLTRTQGFCERPVGLATSDLFFRWMTETYATFVALADPDVDQVDATALARRLQDDVAEVNAQVHAQDQWCLWAVSN